MVDTSTDTKIKEPVVNEMTKAIYERQVTTNLDEFYFVDPQFTGNKPVVTDSNGDIVEATMADNVMVQNGKLSTNFFVGTCSTGASTQKKVVVCPDFVLKENVCIRVFFTNGQTYNGQATLNVNDTGDIGVVRYGTTASQRYCWYTGECVDFVYNGTNWVMVDGGIATTSYYGVVQLANTAGSTSTSTAAVPAALNNMSLYLINGAPVYSTSGTYAVGDICRYTSSSITRMYMCKTAITTGHAWNAAEWDEMPDLFTMITTGQALKYISGYDGSKVQTLKHDASGNVQWVDG